METISVGSTRLVIFRRATRARSISSTRNSQLPTVSLSPAFGKPPSFCVTQPLAVATISSCSISPVILSNSCNGSVPEISQMFSPSRVTSDFSWSNSSWICPTSVFEGVFQGDDTHRSAEFVHNNCEMDFAVEEQLEQFFHRRRFGDVNRLAGQGD